MSSLRTIRLPPTRDFQTAVRTVLPFHVTPRGKPTFTESSLGIPPSSKCSVRLAFLYFSPPTRRSGSVNVEYLSAHMICLCQVKNGIDNILYCRSFPSRLRRRVAGIIGVHRCIHFAGSYGIKADAVFRILDCKILGRRIQPTLRDHRNGAIYTSDRPIGKRRSDTHNASRFLFQHLFHGALSDVEESEQINRDKGVEVLASELNERLCQEDAGVV